jgi:hypothetical protein
VLVKRLQAELVLVFKSFVELEIEVLEPQLAELGLSQLSDGLVNEPHFAEVISPDTLVSEEVNVHKLDNHIDQCDMHFPEFSILIDEFSRVSLDFLDVRLNFAGVVPRDCIISVALRILNDLFELLSLLEHHWHLAVDDLSAHGVVEVSYLFKGNTLFVELFGVGCHGADLSRNLESMFSEDTSILSEGD